MCGDVYSIDVSMNRKLMGRLLERIGVRSLVYAEDGAVAFNAVISRGDLDHFKVIFMDNTMPNMVGVWLVLFFLCSVHCARSAISLFST